MNTSTVNCVNLQTFPSVMLSRISRASCQLSIRELRDRSWGEQGFAREKPNLAKPIRVAPTRLGCWRGGVQGSLPRLPLLPYGDEGEMAAHTVK